MVSKKHFTKAFLTTLTCAMMASNGAVTFAAPLEGANHGTAGNNTGETSILTDLQNSDIHDKDALGSLEIHKFDITSAENDGLTFNYSETDHDFHGTNSTLVTKDGKTIDITSTGQENKAVEEALAPYAIQGVEFTYLKVGDVKTLNDKNHDGIAGDIELVYGVPDDLEDILTHEYLGTPAASETDMDYYTSLQITEALRDRLDDNTTREDGDKTVDVKDELESYIESSGGTAMEDTDAHGVTSAEDLDLGLYLIVETEVPENVTSTVNPWFAEIPMTDIDGESWIYDIVCYPKNQTGHPSIDKLGK